MNEILGLSVNRIATPIGELLIVADHNGNLRAVDWIEHEARMRHFLRLHYGEHGFNLEPNLNPSGLASAINRYFDGEFAAIENLPVQTAGTPFQREVWRALRNIPCGTTISYGDLAAKIGRRTAARAVGLANGQTR